MQNLLSIGVLLVSYLIGSIPFGLLIVKLVTGKDVRKIESGRTGGTNAMRAAGFWAGAATATLDFLKSAFVVWLARVILPGNIWIEVLAPVIAVLGHNYSIFLAERGKNGRIRLRGGAGGAPTAGGVFGLWPPSFLIVVPVGVFILLGIGYASVATMSIPVIATFVFAYRAWMGASPWQFVIYGILTEVILIIGLRSNIKRLFNGTERVIGWRAWRNKKKQMKQAEKSSDHSSSISSSSS